MTRGRNLTVVVIMMLAVAACSGRGHHSSSAEPATTATPSTSAPSSSVAPSTTAPPATAAAGGPVPAGFAAVSFTAVSVDEFWLLGASPCGGSLCTSIIRTTDGGAHFKTIPAPPAPLSYATNSGNPGVIDTLRFADPQDGYAFGLAEGGSAWVTHDGGAHWRPMAIGHLAAFDIGAGEAYAAVSSCATTPCAPPVLERSVPTGDTWTTTPLPGAGGALVSVSAHGSSVWVSVDTANNAGGPGKLLFHSTDRGATFTREASPCTGGLGGAIQAISATVVWAMCPSGMMAQAFRSVDAGASFTHLDAGSAPNSAELAAADAATAVITLDTEPRMLRTADGGKHFAPAFGAPGQNVWFYVGFTTPTVGAALTYDRNAGGPAHGSTLWRTTDAGETFHTVAY